MLLIQIGARVFRFALLFLFACFFFMRQIYANLFGISRPTITALFVLVMAAIAIWIWLERAKRPSPRFRVIDGIIAAQLIIVVIFVSGCWLSGKINSPEAVYAIYYYCFAPLLLYIGFYLHRKQEKEIREYLVAACMVFAIMLFASVLQVLGVDWILFRNDRWVFQPTFFGVSRATGVYGTQIDFALLCFMFFVFSLYRSFETGSLWSSFIAVLAFLGTVLTFSRVFIFACIVVFLSQFLRPSVLGSLKRKGITLLAVALLAGLCATAFQKFNIVSIFLAEDELTQLSNEGRVDYLRSMPKWLLEDYPYMGTGPGTQNGPNDETKFVSDFLWLALLVEFGSMFGSLVVALKAVLLALVARNYFRSTIKSSFANAAFVLSAAFFLVSFVDSAFAHMVNISLFYLIVGAFLYRCYESNSNTREAIAGV